MPYSFSHKLMRKEKIFLLLKQDFIDLTQQQQSKTDSDSKLPNYFLPRDDMEKSMKRLHFNYKMVDIKLVKNMIK